MRIVETALSALLATGCASAIELQGPRVNAQLQALEAGSGGRLGVAMADSSGRIIAGNRANERFAFCSTFKLLLAGMILDRHRQGLLSLDERLKVSAKDIVFHSPVTKTRVEQGWITIHDAARSIVTVSDNAAANLLVRRIGGAPALNAWIRTLGDQSTRLDRPEPDLNSNHPGDPRDTTTPAAIATSSAKLVFGDALSGPERQMLRNWLIESETGLKRIRAGMPPGFVAGDKTGTCGAKGRESYNDVAFILPNGSRSGRGYVVAAYLDHPGAGGDAANALLAAVGRSVAAPMAKQP